MSYFPESVHSKNEVKVELYLSSYATKSDLKNAIGLDTSGFSRKADLTSFISDVDKLDVDELKKNTRWLK